MTAYVVTAISVTDATKYEDYKRLSGPAVAANGGRFIARGGALEVLEGDWPHKRVVLLEFPTVDAAKKFYTSVEYVAARQARVGAAEFNMVIVEGV
ncbi:MAG: hypothetical protein RLZZ502_305 [Pseudomonadota bacterium]|jgi:uncharacterized protein (DUF1330 family)